MKNEARALALFFGFNFEGKRGYLASEKEFLSHNSAGLKSLSRVRVPVVGQLIMKGVTVSDLNVEWEYFGFFFLVIGISFTNSTSQSFESEVDFPII